MKVPSKEDIERRDKCHALILEVLKEDAKKELERRYISKERRRVLEFLIEKNTYFGGFQYWNPSIEARRQLREKGLAEDEFVEGNSQFKQRCRDALEILKEDAGKQLNSEEFTHPDTEDINNFLIQQNEFTGDLSPWCPSGKAIEELRGKRLIEEKYHVEGYFSPLQKWILQNIEERIRKEEMSPFINLIQEELAPYIESFYPDFTQNEYVFCRLGDVWFIRYKEERAVLEALDRLKYIVHLLHYPYRELDVIELMEFVKGINLDDWFMENTQSFEDGEVEDDWKAYNDVIHDDEIESRAHPKTPLPKQESIDSEFDEEDIERYHDILRTQYNMYQNENEGSEQYKKFKKEYEDSKKSIRNDIGILTSETVNGLIFHKETKIPYNKDKIRSNITQQIKSAMIDIAEEMPAFGKHLYQYLKKGYHSSYSPPLDQPD